jgi:hypothetical protein
VSRVGTQKAPPVSRSGLLLGLGCLGFCVSVCPVPAASRLLGGPFAGGASVVAAAMRLSFLKCEPGRYSVLLCLQVAAGGRGIGAAIHADNFIHCF